MARKPTKKLRLGQGLDDYVLSEDGQLSATDGAGAVFALKDVGPYPVYSTVLLSEAWVPEAAHHREHMFFCYAIGGDIGGGPSRIAAHRLETNLRVPNQFVDEAMKVVSIDIAIPRVALSAYQMNPAIGSYSVTVSDVASLASCGMFQFFCGGDKPFVEGSLAMRPLVPVTDILLGHVGTEEVHVSDGGWLARIADFGDYPLPIHRIEKFWGSVSFSRENPKFGRHGYNPAVIPVIMILNGIRERGVQ